MRGSCAMRMAVQREAKVPVSNESADGWEAAASQEVVMQQPARADERRLQADNNCKQQERAADESRRRGKEGIAPAMVL